MSDHTCIHCGTPLVRVSSREGRDAFAKRKFCNRECRREWERSRERPPVAPRLPYVRFLDRTTWRVPT